VCVQDEGEKEDSINNQRQILKYKNYKQRRGKRNNLKIRLTYSFAIKDFSGD